MYGITSKQHSTFGTIGGTAADEKGPQTLLAKTQAFALPGRIILNMPTCSKARLQNFELFWAFK